MPEAASSLIPEAGPFHKARQNAFAGDVFKHGLNAAALLVIGCGGELGAYDNAHGVLMTKPFTLRSGTVG